ncbi:TonB-dependent receptor plug domain-containing protein [Sphingomonas sp. 37zxx]|uniref:TonB-dependent receptor plug domain-containing protein n=1 Tax=Sphingomonas sp. 37zxx TaxID=1550073 RepID=UPI000B054E7C
MITTGMAKGRDRLDSATSASVLRGSEIDKLGPLPLSEILRTIPGIRVESATGDGNSSSTVRGLPMASGGSKYLQLEEDCLPVLEFGDIFNMASDTFLRADFNVAQIEAIRGGSSSTFASNSPGGVINIISKNGDAAIGRNVMASLRLDF